ncbi:MAG: hypothetical protein OXH57_03570 [Ekhidna sp.]|nr:hypothetical protein [Ekhidna sp.]
MSSLTKLLTIEPQRAQRSHEGHGAMAGKEIKSVTESCLYLLSNYLSILIW